MTAFCCLAQTQTVKQLIGDLLLTLAATASQIENIQTYNARRTIAEILKCKIIMKLQEIIDLIQTADLM